MIPPRLDFRLSLLGLALLAAGCAQHVPTAAQPCPCADGATCCASGICAQSMDLCDEATSALSAAAVGQWTGYLENYTVFKSGADSVALAFTMNADGTLAGTAKLGDAAPPAPATDPNMEWPPGFSSYDDVGTPIEGFVYTAHDIRWEARRLKFTIALTEPWSPWCALQQPYLESSAVPGPMTGGAAGVGGDSAGAAGASGAAGATGIVYGPPGPPVYRCVPNDISAIDDTHCLISADATTGSPAIPIACEKVFLCAGAGRPCVCTATSCMAGDGSNGDSASFDISLRANDGDGSFDAGGGMNNNVRLTRASR